MMNDDSYMVRLRTLILSSTWPLAMQRTYHELLYIGCFVQVLLEVALCLQLLGLLGSVNIKSYHSFHAIKKWSRLH